MGVEHKFGAEEAQQWWERQSESLAHQSIPVINAVFQDETTAPPIPVARTSPGPVAGFRIPNLRDWVLLLWPRAPQGPRAVRALPHGASHQSVPTLAQLRVVHTDQHAQAGGGADKEAILRARLPPGRGSDL